MHVGPDDYDDPDQIAEFMMEAGDESTECYYFHAENERMLFFGQHYRLRPGTHHLIMGTHLELGADPDWKPAPEGWGPDCRHDGYFTIGGTQRAVSDFPEGNQMAPEDEHLGRPLTANAAMEWQLHYVNTKEEPILREGWLNMIDVPWDEDARVLGGIFFSGGLEMDLPPGQTEIYNHECTMGADERRVVTLFGHRHANTPRFTVWKNSGDERTLIYEDYDWDEPAELHYNSIVQNPAPDPELGIAGGYSGILTLKKGDTLEWECEVVNNQDANLHFGDYTYTAEMCNLFGWFDGLLWSGAPERRPCEGGT